MAERDGMRWGLARRFEFIEWRIFWTGRVNRRDLEEQFLISTPQASSDFKEYLDAAEGNIEYDPTGKAYVPTTSFEPRFLRLSADRYLLQAASILTGAIQTADTWFGSPPPITVVPRMQRSVNPHVLHTLIRAIEGRREVEIDYRSLTSTRTRGIVPHSLAFDGNRWHVRAWCASKRDFRDFVLARMLKANPETKESDADPNDDVEWNRFVHLRIAPDPRLSTDQRAAIERDYGLADGEMVISTRAAFAYYVMRHMNLDEESDHLSPTRRQLCLVNRNEIQKQISEARAATKSRVASKRQSLGSQGHAPDV